MIKRVSLALLAGYWTYCIIIYTRLPARIPTHFNSQGQPDAWSDNVALAWFALPVLATVTLLVVFGSAALAHRSPQLWNVPRKKEFLQLTHEQRAPIIRRIIGIMDLVALWVVALFWLAQYATRRTAEQPDTTLPMLFHIVLWGGLAMILILAFNSVVGVRKMIMAASAAPLVGQTSKVGSGFNP